MKASVYFSNAIFKILLGETRYLCKFYLKLLMISYYKETLGWKTDESTLPFVLRVSKSDL
jgi:hypothetical protein